MNDCTCTYVGTFYLTAADVIPDTQREPAKKSRPNMKLEMPPPFDAAKELVLKKGKIN